MQLIAVESVDVCACPTCGVRCPGPGEPALVLGQVYVCWNCGARFKPVQAPAEPKPVAKPRRAVKR